MTKNYIENYYKKLKDFCRDFNKPRNKFTEKKFLQWEENKKVVVTELEVWA